MALVAAGGFVGAMLRYHLSGWIYARAAGRAPWLPWGTLGVNVAGCFVLGLILPALAGAADAVSTPIVAGLIGAFTTFSTFAYETFMLLEDGEHGRAAVYVGASLALGTLALLAGLGAAGMVH